MKRFASRLVAFLALTELCLWPAASVAGGQSKSGAVAILHASVVDVRTGAVAFGTDVLVSADHIAAIGRSGTLQIPKSARRLDARHKFLIPGLWDMHVHMMWRNEVSFYAPLFIANGVAGVRDMGCPLADLDLLPHWRRQIAEGKLVGPRIFASGPQLDGPKSVGSSAYVLHSPDEARRVVRLLKKKGERLAGTIEAGKHADLVLLDANPLDDIRNTRRIFAVIAGGRPFTRADLDKLLADVASAVQKDQAAATLGPQRNGGMP